MKVTKDLQIPGWNIYVCPGCGLPVYYKGEEHAEKCSSCKNDEKKREEE